jgi:hypothetical protein
LQVSVAGGRHSYEGWTIVDNYLVVDMSNMTEVCGQPQQQHPADQYTQHKAGCPAESYTAA